MKCKYCHRIKARKNGYCKKHKKWKAVEIINKKNGNFSLCSNFIKKHCVNIIDNDIYKSTTCIACKMKDKYGILIYHILKYKYKNKIYSY